MEIREAKVADALEIARVHVDSWRSTYAGMMPQDYLDQLDVEKRAHRWVEILSSGEPKEANLVAVIGGKVAGFTSIGPSRSPSLASLPNSANAARCGRGSFSISS